MVNRRVRSFTLRDRLGCFVLGLSMMRRRKAQLMEISDVRIEFGLVARHDWIKKVKCRSYRLVEILIY